MTIHLVYPHRRGNRAPDSIGHNLARGLSHHDEVLCYDWDSGGRIKHSSSDVLIGHPHPAPFTVMRRSWSDKWRRRIVITPFTGSLHTMAYVDHFVRSADAYVAITGVSWFSTLPFGHLSHWLQKSSRTDLAIDPEAFPPVKLSYSAAGNRSFLYIGSTSYLKGPEYLASLAQLLPGTRFGRVGGGSPIPGFHEHGPLPCDSERMRKVVGEYDFLLATGRYDANPTTVIEAMGWGLIPMSTPTAGYVLEDGVVPLPPIDPFQGMQVLREWNQFAEERLVQLRDLNWKRVATRYNWQNLIEVVRRTLDAPKAGRALQLPVRDRAVLLTARLSSPTTWSRNTLRTGAGAIVTRNASASSADPFGDSPCGRIS